MEYKINKELIEKLESHYYDEMPGAMLYGICLYEAKSKLKLTIDECREKFGGFTNKEWIEVLND